MKKLDSILIALRSHLTAKFFSCPELPPPEETAAASARLCGEPGAVGGVGGQPCESLCGGVDHKDC